MNCKFFILSLVALGAIPNPTLAQDVPAASNIQRIKRIVEPIRAKAARVNNIHRVAAAKTPSGFAVPRYVSLKVGTVNGRTGPSRQHPIAWQYRRKGLPLVVVAETEMWRKVRDVTGDESWIHKPALSGIRRVLVLEQAALHSKPKDTARILAIAERNAVLNLEDCDEMDWCKVRSEEGLKGWTQRYKLWGAQKLY